MLASPDVLHVYLCLPERTNCLGKGTTVMTAPHGQGCICSTLVTSLLICIALAPQQHQLTIGSKAADVAPILGDPCRMYDMSVIEVGASL